MTTDHADLCGVVARSTGRPCNGQPMPDPLADGRCHHHAPAAYHDARTAERTARAAAEAEQLDRITNGARRILRDDVMDSLDPASADGRLRLNLAFAFSEVLADPAVGAR